MKSGSIHIGTSGWSYKHWSDLFYPDDLPSPHWLAYYSERFSCVEINSSFYHLPQPKTLKGWTEKVPANFIFCPKLSRYVTQFKKLNEPEEPMQRFFSVFEPFRKYLGPILIQLPPTLSFHEEQAEGFFELLISHYRQFSFSLEVRHESWLNKKAVELMNKYRIGFVISHSNGKFPYAEHITARHIYIRFHGPDQLYGSKYPRKVLEDFAKKLERWRDDGHQVYAFFNNDAEAYATEDAQALMEMTGTLAKL